MLIERCICGNEVFEYGVMHGIKVATCKCGVMHQLVDLKEEEYRSWYEMYEDVHESDAGHVDGGHTYQHDSAIARKRIQAHDWYLGKRVLDVGCYHGAFVHAVRATGRICDGCDLVKNGLDFYQDDFLNVHFPSELYDTVTMHDVFEHFVDLNASLKEAYRVLKPDGYLIIDYPAFFNNYGKHHWRKIQHLWMLTIDQLKSLISNHGFVVEKIDTPINSKIVVYARRKLREKIIRIFIPPGIGDIYWVMCKMEAFIKDIGCGLPDVYIQGQMSQDRSLSYVQRIPFVKAYGYYSKFTRDKHWRNALLNIGPVIVKDYAGLDYLFAVNGPLAWNDTPLEEILPEYKTNWFHPMFVSLKEHQYGRSAQKTFGSYIVSFFPDHGFHQKWLMELPPDRLYEVLRRLYHETDCKIILTGAQWDNNLLNAALLQIDRSITGDKFLVNLINQTTLEEFFGLLRYADGCFGYPGGNTIMATVFRIPTEIVWSSRFYKSKFHQTACPTESYGKWYIATDAYNNSSDEMVEAFVKVFNYNFSGLNLQRRY